MSAPSLVKPLAALAALAAVFYAGRWSKGDGAPVEKPAPAPGTPVPKPHGKGARKPGGKAPANAHPPIVNVGGPLTSTTTAPALPGGATGA